MIVSWCGGIDDDVMAANKIDMINDISNTNKGFSSTSHIWFVYASWWLWHQKQVSLA